MRRDTFLKSLAALAAAGLEPPPIKGGTAWRCRLWRPACGG